MKLILHFNRVDIKLKIMNKPESKEEIADQHKDIQSRHCTSEKGTLKISHSLVHESTSCDMTMESNSKITESVPGDSDDDIEDNGSEVNIASLFYCLL